MKKDKIVLSKILKYCNQIEETCSLYNNDFHRFENEHIFHNACCMCVLQIGELAKLVSVETREEEEFYYGDY